MVVITYSGQEATVVREAHLSKPESPILLLMNVLKAHYLLNCYFFPHLHIFFKHIRSLLSFRLYDNIVLKDEKCTTQNPTFNHLYHIKCILFLHKNPCSLLARNFLNLMLDARILQAYVCLQRRFCL